MIKILNLTLATLVFILGVGSCSTMSYIQRSDKVTNLPMAGTKFTNGNNTYSSLVRLMQEGSFFCSGFVIDANYVVTAAHCVEDMAGLISDKKIHIFDPELGDTGIVAEAVALDKFRDVAFLKGDFSEFATQLTDFYGEDVKLGMMVKSCGFPSGGPMFCTDLVHVGNKNFMYRTMGGPIYKGMSGGPVINIKTGRAIGVNSGVDTFHVIVGPTVGVLKAVGLQ